MKEFRSKKILSPVKFDLSFPYQLETIPMNKSVYRDLFIVVDTSVFLSNLDVLDEVISIKKVLSKF